MQIFGTVNRFKQSGAWPLFVDIFASILRNVFTPATILICSLIIILLLIKQRGDALFLASTITVNSLIAIIQEIRAKKALRRLELLNTPQVRRITNKGIRLTNLKDISIGDFVSIEPGDQIGVDGRIINNDSCQIDESLLTGESSPVSKNVGDSAYAGSIVVSGKATLKVTAVQDQTRVSQMSAALRWYDQKLTPLQKNIYQLIRYLTYLALAMSVLIYFDGHQGNLGATEKINTIVAGAVSLVPEGLILASTVLFSYGALQMASLEVLVQRLAAIEGFSRLNFLCLDKTGTLTENRPSLHCIEPLRNYNLEAVYSLLNGLVRAEPSPNPTLLEIMTAIPKKIQKHAIDIINKAPFSSARKYSGAAFHNLQENSKHSIILGAPEILAERIRLNSSETARIEQLTKLGLRVLLLIECKTENQASSNHLDNAEGRPAALLAFSSRLRPGVIDSIFFLQAQGIKLKVISGDNPATVSYTAKKAGILDSHIYLTGDQLALLSESERRKKITQTTVFARVLPEQKKQIINTLRQEGFTGMVGDGVNDALALKTADLSVAMAQGSQASRQIADVVLLNNSFSAFPVGMRLGTQIILGLEMVACVFMNKIVLSLVILVLSMLFNTQFPFEARHLLILNLYIIGLPTLLWSLTPPRTTRRLNPRHFFKRIMGFATLNGLITGIAVMSGYVTTLWQTAGNTESSRSVALYITFALGVFSFWLIPRFLQAIDNRQIRAWQVFYLAFCPTTLILLVSQPWFIKSFHLAKLHILQWLVLGFVILAAAGLQKVSLVKVKPEFKI